METVGGRGRSVWCSGGADMGAVLLLDSRPGCERLVLRLEVTSIYSACCEHGEPVSHGWTARVSVPIHTALLR